MLPDRQSTRLRGYDYASAGAYFVTICAHERRCLFGEIVDGAMSVSALGQIVEACWVSIPTHFPSTTLDDFVVMPNHVHGIIVLGDTDTPPVGAQHAAPAMPDAPEDAGSAHRINVPAGSLGAIVRSFKAAATKRINDLRRSPGESVWQRNYYDHIIPDQEGLMRVRAYIANNPARWAFDAENPDVAHR